WPNTQRTKSYRDWFENTETQLVALREQSVKNEEEKEKKKRREQYFIA
ncbi:16267_t:CDS:1, partial [Dentiscutata heterogama]